MSDYYILKDGVPHKCGLFEWADWFENHGNERILEQTAVGTDGEIGVSTIFLGIDHCFIKDEPHMPLLFETMIFGGPHHGEMERCSTMEQAEAQHKVMVERASRGAPKELKIKYPDEEESPYQWGRAVMDQIRAALERDRLRQLTGMPYPTPDSEQLKMKVPERSSTGSQKPKKGSRP